MSIVTLNNRALKDATAVGSITGLGDLIFISRSTASTSSNISFTSGIDNTYKEYIFFWNSINPSNDVTNFEFNMSVDGGSNYNVTKTTTFFRAYNKENAGDKGFAYDNPDDLQQSTNYVRLAVGTGADGDQSCSGYLHIFDPSDTTFTKHYIARCNNYIGVNYSFDSYMGGYGNTTSAVNAIDFRYSAGNIVSGTIDLYGVN